jgi:hypothetical protein
MLRFISVFLVSWFAEGTSIIAAGASKHLRQKSLGASFISTLEFKLELRVCNAYPYTYPMDVYLGKEKLTETALSYKVCGTFHPTLKVGDKLDFKISDTSAGSFTVQDLPQNDAVLMLVIFRHDTRSTAVSFESHVFANLLNAQVAVLDTYRGNAQATPRIEDAQKHSDKEGHVQRSEELRYNSVVALNQGVYDVVLHALDGETVKAKHQLVALNRESYLVVRCGVETEEGQAFPQDLMVYPQSDPAQLGSATKSSLFAAVLVTVLSVAASVFEA